MLFKPTKVRGTFMSNYWQLTQEQRYQIYALMKAVTDCLKLTF